MPSSKNSRLPSTTDGRAAFVSTASFAGSRAADRFVGRDARYIHRRPEHFNDRRSRPRRRDRRPHRGPRTRRAWVQRDRLRGQRPLRWQSTLDADRRRSGCAPGRTRLPVLSGVLPARRRDHGTDPRWRRHRRGQPRRDRSDADREFDGPESHRRDAHPDTIRGWLEALRPAFAEDLPARTFAFCSSGCCTC